jgi:hypothetical protein
MTDQCRKLSFLSKRYTFQIRGSFVNYVLAPTEALLPPAWDQYKWINSRPFCSMQASNPDLPSSLIDKLEFTSLKSRAAFVPRATTIGRNKHLG